MATTTNLYGTKLEVGQAQKEATINELFDLLDGAVAGIQAISTTGGTTTLTGTQAAPQAQKMFLSVTGTLTSNATIEIPVSVTSGRNRSFAVKNATSGAYTLTVKAVGGTGVTVTQGNTVILLYNGTDIQYAAPQIVTSTGVIAASALSGAWTAVSFAAGNFTANGSMTWTVDSGDVTRNHYMLLGKTLLWNLFVISTTVGGTLNNQLKVAIPGGYTPQGSNSGACWIYDNGVGVPGLWETSGTTIIIYRADLANFTAATNVTQVRFSAVFEVQ